MKIAIWILHIGMAAMLLWAGLGKIISPYEELVKELPWAVDFSPIMIKVIAGLELLGGLGMLLPLFIKVLPKILIPLAAAGLTVIMLGAFGTHLLRGETVESLVTLTFAAFTGIVAFKRYKELNA